MTKDVRQLRNCRKIWNLNGYIAQYPVSLAEIQTLAVAVKKYAKVDVNVL